MSLSFPAAGNAEIRRIGPSALGKPLKLLDRDRADVRLVVVAADSRARASSSRRRQPSAPNRQMRTRRKTPSPPPLSRSPLQGQ